MYEFYSMSNERLQEWRAADQERENKMQKFNKHIKKKPLIDNNNKVHLCMGGSKYFRIILKR